MGYEIDLHRLRNAGIQQSLYQHEKRQDFPFSCRFHHSEYASQGPFIHHHKGMHSEHRHNHHSEYAMVYSDLIEDKIDALITLITATYQKMDNMRCTPSNIWKWIKYSGSISTCGMEQIVDKSYEKDIINQKYDFIEEIIDEVLVNKAQKAASTERIDKYLTGKWLGLPIFLLIMAFVFFLTFTVGDWLKGYFEIALEVFSNLVSNGLAAVHTSPMLTSLIVDGIISGVGGILTFLPNIFILFLALALLEDSGYMSRVAFVMDDIMSSLGLSGRAFLPLLLGFGCTVPAVMASRALENKRDRFKTILITPFMSCSARLPIYVLFSSMFFGKYAMIVCYSMYLLGIIIAITTAFILSKIDGSKATHALLIELPEYKTPSAHTIAIYVWQKIKIILQSRNCYIYRIHLNVGNLKLWSSWICNRYF